MQHPIERFRLGPRSAGFVALIAVLLLTVSSPAGADSSNLLPNGSFEAGTSGWTTTNEPWRSRATEPTTVPPAGSP